MCICVCLPDSWRFLIYSSMLTLNVVHTPKMASVVQIHQIQTISYSFNLLIIWNLEPSSPKGPLVQVCSTLQIASYLPNGCNQLTPGLQTAGLQVGPVPCGLRATIPEAFVAFPVRFVLTTRIWTSWFCFKNLGVWTKYTVTKSCFNTLAIWSLALPVFWLPRFCFEPHFIFIYTCFFFFFMFEHVSLETNTTHPRRVRCDHFKQLQRWQSVVNELTVSLTSLTVASAFGFGFGVFLHVSWETMWQKCEIWFKSCEI